MSLRVLSYNIRFGGWGRQHALSSVIRACDPDIVLLQEATRPDVVEELGRTCGMRQWGALRGQSLAFLSRIEIGRHAWHSIRFAKRSYLELILAGSSTRLFGVHLSAVHSNLTERRRSYELRALLRGIAQHQHGFHVVAGDFNTLAPTEKLDINRLPFRLQAMVWMTGRKLRWQTIQLMLDGGYLDGYRLFHQEDAGFTFPTWDPHVRLDYAFVPLDMKARLTNCAVVRDVASLREASDHFPLLFEIDDVVNGS